VNYTKGELVKAALTEIGIADYEFDITPEEEATGIRRLDSMMAQWSDKGIRISYNFVGSSADEAGLPNIAQEAVISNLALRLAPTYGKQVPPEVRSTAKRALNSLYSEAAYPNEMQLQTTPIGSGYKSGFESDVFFTPDTSPDSRATCSSPPRNETSGEYGTSTTTQEDLQTFRSET